MKIRIARGRDAEALAALAGQLGYPGSAEEMRARLRRVMKRPDHGVFVAERGRRVVAWLHVQSQLVLELAEHAEIVGLVVDEARRGEGIGAELVARAEAWARREGLKTLRVRSNVIRKRAHAFYLKAGFGLEKTQRMFQKNINLLSSP